MSFKIMKSIEQRGLQRTSIFRYPLGGGGISINISNVVELRIIFLFLLIVVGILANWFWTIGWAYLANPNKGLQLGPSLVIFVRILLSFIAAALTFVPTFNKINQSSSESWIPYALAFQNGFFWQAAFDAVVKQFQV